MKDLLLAVAWVMLGVLGGFVLWMFSVVALFLLGFSFAALVYAPYAAFVIWLIGAPISYARLRRRGSRFKRGLLLFLAGMLAFHVVWLCSR